MEACAKLACETAVIDGEMVVQDEHGITNFNALRSAIYRAPHRLVFFAFDLLHLDGQNNRGQPLMERSGAPQKADPAGSPLPDSVQRSCRGRRRPVLLRLRPNLG